MLFEDVIIQKNQDLTADFGLLFTNALRNQTHSGDLLLIQVNGFYNPEVYGWDNVLHKEPYMIGVGFEGHADMFHYKFIDMYRSSAVSEFKYADWVRLQEFSETRLQEIRQLEQREAFTIQVEMLIYLKIWEADLFIKKFYQIANLCNGDPYDWHFKISESSRGTKGTGKREEIIRKKIRDRLQAGYPSLYAAMKNAYKTQIRNAIAHSRYFCTGRHIHLTNYIKEDPASQIQVIPFEEWTHIFHDTMAIYNQLIGFCNRIDDYYSGLINSPNDTVLVRLNRKEPEVKTQFIPLQYRREFNDWHPQQR